MTKRLPPVRQYLIHYGTQYKNLAIY